MAKDTQQTPWYKENPFWGAIGGFFTFGFTGVAFVMSGYPVLGRVLFAMAFPWAFMGIWIAIKGLLFAKPKLIKVVSIVSFSFLGLSWYVGDYLLRTLPEDSKVARIIKDGQDHIGDFEGPFERWEAESRVMPPESFATGHQLYEHEGKQFFLFADVYVHQINQRLGIADNPEDHRLFTDFTALDGADSNSFPGIFAFRSSIGLMKVKAKVNRLCRSANKADIYTGVPPLD